MLFRFLIGFEVKELNMIYQKVNINYKCVKSEAKGGVNGNVKLLLVSF